MDIISPLLSAASNRWPDVFKAEELDRLKEYVLSTDDSKIQVLRARQGLLNLAEGSCFVCMNCALNTNRLGGGPVFADGTVTAKVFVVGEGPGQYEQRTLIPFTHRPEYGSSGCFLACKNHDLCFPEDCVRSGAQLPTVECNFEQDSEEITKKASLVPLTPNSTAVLLNKAIHGLFTRESWNKRRSILMNTPIASELYITNVIKCRYIDEHGCDKAPLIEHTKPCSMWLDIQLSLVQPEVLVLVGRIAATKYFGTKFSVKVNNGLFSPVDELNIKGIPKSVKYVGTVMHPAGISRLNDEEKHVEWQKMRDVFIKAKDVLSA